MRSPYNYRRREGRMRDDEDDRVPSLEASIAALAADSGAPASFVAKAALTQGRPCAEPDQDRLKQTRTKAASRVKDPPTRLGLRQTLANQT